MDFWVALLSFGGAAITAVASILIVYHRVAADNRRFKDAMDRFEAAGQGATFSEFATLWSGFLDQVENLLSSTEITHFSLLRAHNGKADPEWITLLLKINEEGHQSVVFFDITLDKHFRDLLKSCWVREQRHVSEPPGGVTGVLDALHLANNLFESRWFHLDSKPTSAKVVEEIYCSFGSDEEISDVSATRCCIVADYVRGLIRLFS